MIMYEFFEDLLKIINNEVYDPISSALINSDWFNEVVNFINNLLIALFGNTSQITINQLASIISITFLIIVIVIIVKCIIEFTKIFKLGGLKNDFKKR